MQNIFEIISRTNRGTTKLGPYLITNENSEYVLIATQRSHITK